MGGKEARDGFWFQDAKALTRLLDDAIERRRRVALGLELGPELRVRIESAVEIVIEPTDAIPQTSTRPIWDGTFTIGDVTVVDECKLSEPTRNERVTLYRRLRTTIATSGSVSRLVPRLTIGQGSIKEIGRWAGLGVAAQSARVVRKPPVRVDRVEKLAKEALYYLTAKRPVWSLKEKNENKTEPPWAPPLLVEDARALLLRFELDATSTIDDVEAKLLAQTAALGASLPADELVDLLAGWIGKIARAGHWEEDLTADLLGEKLALVARYLKIEPRVEQLWLRLRTMLPPAPVSSITEQPWRDVQPHLETIIRGRADNCRVVFTSEGGIGKSYLLGALYSEQIGMRVWIDAVAPLSDLEEAVALGAWAVSRTGTPLTIFVDAIDQITDPAGLLATIERSLATCDGAVVYVAARSTTWMQVRDQLRRWCGTKLSRWSNDRIRALAESHRAEPLSADLIDLLRTPLLLDLFLRTFALGDTIPAGLAARHGVLRAYFERRVYAGAGAGARRLVLDAGVDAVLANRASWREDSSAALELLSEGVVVNVFGELRFRHTLLRDFSAALRLTSRGAAETARNLKSVESPIVRNELLRGTVEALLDPTPIACGPSVAEIVHTCMQEGLAPGIALGTTDAPTPSLLAEIAPIDNGAVLRQALGHAHLIGNRAWLRIPSALGAARPEWLGESQLQALGSLAELASSSGDAASGILASTLRLWTFGRRVGEEESWSIVTIGSLLVRVLPDDSTGEWFANLVLGKMGFRSQFLSQLRTLGTSAQIADAVLTRALNNIVFNPEWHVLDGGHSLWEITNPCILGNDDDEGLLAARPYVASSLMFLLSVTRQIEMDRRRAEEVWDPMIARMFASHPVPSDLADAEMRLRVDPKLTKEEALGDLVDDVRATDGRPHDYLSAIIEEAGQRASEHEEFANLLVEAALASRSVRARIVVLSLTHGDHVEEAIVEILRDPRIYHVLDASFPLWDAIHESWPRLSAKDRGLVQQNILALAKSPLLRFTCVGQLASAVPQVDLSAELQPYLEFLKTTGRSTKPVRPTRSETVSRRPDDDDDDTPKDPHLARLEELAALQNEDAATDEAIAILEREIERFSVTTQNAMWFEISCVVDRDRRRATPRINERVARALFEATLEAIPTLRHDLERWMTLLKLASACVLYTPNEESIAMKTRLIDEVTIGAGERAEQGEHARWALHFVDSRVWFTEGTGGRVLFETWLRDYLHGDALKAGQRLLHFIPGDTRLEILCYVLEKDGRLEVANSHGFINQAGRMLASWSLWWEPALARDRFTRMCGTAVRSGALAEVAAWRAFLAGFADSLQDEVRCAEPDPCIEPALARFALLLRLAWSAWSQVVDNNAQHNASLGSAITAPLSNHFAAKIQPPANGWAAHFRALLASVICEGGHGDIGAFQQVVWAKLDFETATVVAGAAISRLNREIASRPPTDWMINSLLEILEGVGTLAALPLASTHGVLDCLQRVSSSAPRAISAAVAVERALRARELNRAQP